MKKSQNDTADFGCSLVQGSKRPGCDNYSRRLDILQKVIDEQATGEELEQYRLIMNECAECKCKEYCEEQLVIKNLVQTKIDRKRVPIDLIDTIKSKIGQSQ
jgi:hypothetical protein